MSNSKITKRVVGAAGAAVALTAGVGLMTATPAQADVWDNVAQCESSGNWSTNTGNGFSGGLQFTQQTWNANGGSGSASGASKGEQKRVAKNVLKTQGPGAWPVCGAKAGLSRSNGGSSSGSSSSSNDSNSGSSSNSNNYSSSKSNGSSSNNYSSGNSNGSSSNNYSSGNSNGSSSNNYSSNGSSNYSSNGSSNYSSNGSSDSSSNGSSNYTAKRSTGTYSEPTHRLPKRSYKGTGEYVTIQSGDTLAKIASEHNVKGGWTALWSINSSKISNPDVVLAGTKIEL